MLTIDVLTTTEQAQLQQQEARIEQGLKTFFWEVGNALEAIQEERLYRASYSTFEDYCQERWGFKANYARKLIRASKAIGNLKSAGVQVLPATEGQTREITKLDDPEQQIEAWLDAVQNTSNGNPAANQVKAAVERVQQRAALTPGSRAKVVSGQHEGEEVEVRKTENGGAIVHSKLSSGESFPFLAGELEVIEAAPAPVPSKPRPSLKDENQQLRHVLRQILAEVGSSLSSDLLAAAQALIQPPLAQ